MVWLVPTVGYVDKLGYLRCAECARDDQRQHAVDGGQHFGKDDKCDACGWQFEHLPSSKYVERHGEWGRGTPDWSHTTNAPMDKQP